MKRLFIIITLLLLLANTLYVFSHPVDKSNPIYINVKDFGAKGDGSTDDTEAIKNAAGKAYAESKVLYFPTGTYDISDSIKFGFDNSKTLTLQGGTNAVITTPEDYEGDIFVSNMEFNFYVKNLKFIHKGPKGQILNSHYLNAYNCIFEGNSTNKSTLVSFAGSNCKVQDCTFITKNENSYALEYVRRPEKISINDYIIDNTFAGVGKGLRIAASSMDGRPEGLKVNGCTFENSNSVQILVECILHLDISDNTFKNSTGTAIKVVPRDLGVHGLFITGNSIQAQEYCIEAQDNGLGTIHIADNYIHDSKIGVFMNKSFADVHVHNNYFKNISDTPVKLLNAFEIYVAENVIEDSGKSLHITGRKGNFVIENNIYSKKAIVDIENYKYKETLSNQVNIYVVLSIIFSIGIVVLIAVLVFLLKKKT
ncbi:MAG: hypothetical protein GX166_11790 [Clostridiaceae bacterium]|nr:hypothetical protein [Clostridiaceae bacterium]